MYINHKLIIYIFIYFKKTNKILYYNYFKFYLNEFYYIN